MNEIEYQVSKRWSAGKDFRKPFTYRLEDSEQDVLVRRIDMSDILAMGLVDEMDFVSKAIAKVTEEKASPEENSDGDSKDQPNPFMENNGANFSRLQKMVNAVALAGIIAPKVYAIPDHEAARQEGLMYVDEIPWDDRMELFTVIFGRNDEESFLDESEPDVGTVENVTDVPLPADDVVADESNESAGVLSEPSSV